MVSVLRYKDGKYLYVKNEYSSVYLKRKEELLGTYMQDLFDEDLIAQYRWRWWYSIKL